MYVCIMYMYLVLYIGRLSLCVGTGSSVAELHLRGEHLGTCSNAPGDDGLEEPSRPQPITYLVLLYAPNLRGEKSYTYISFVQ